MFILNEKRINIYAPFTTPEGVTYGNLTDPAVRDQIGVIEVSEPTPPEDYSESTYYRTEQDEAPYVVYTRKSDEQIAEAALNEAKQERAQAVAGIIVTTTSGNSFDGYEDAQNRMARALLGLSDTDTMPWVLADNSIVQITKAELQEALRLSGTAMAELWVKPYV